MISIMMAAFTSTFTMVLFNQSNSTPEMYLSAQTSFSYWRLNSDPCVRMSVRYHGFASLVSLEYFCFIIKVSW